jgi:hypothetical protein
MRGLDFIKTLHVEQVRVPERRLGTRQKKGGNMQDSSRGLRSFLLFSALFAFLLLPAFAFGGGAAPDTELDALKAQVRALMQRIQVLESQQGQAAPTADTAELEKKVAELEKWKADRSKMSVQWKNGFRIRYQDPEKNRDYLMRLRAGIQMRYTYVWTDDDIPSNEENYSSFIMRRLRLFVDGYAPNKDWKYFMHIQLEPQGKVHTHDAFIVWRKYKYARVQFGRMKIPFGMEYWQSGFRQNGCDRTIFTGDSEVDYDKFGNRTYDIPGSNERLRVGSHRRTNGFATGGMLLYRSQGINLNGDLDLFGQKQFLNYVIGVYNGRDTQGMTSGDSDMLYVARLGINFLPGSDPRGPLGPKGFNSYFNQGDYGYNTTPLAALILGGFTYRDRVTKLYRPGTVPSKPTRPQSDFSSVTHDVENYGFDVALLFRYMGFSADIEGAWEEFIQDPSGEYEDTWDRWGMRVNLGYFIVPKKWEVTAKFAMLERLEDNNAFNSIHSGLGLVETDDGYAVEDKLYQYRLGINYYLHGFNQYISAEVGWFQRTFEEISSADAAALGVDRDSSPNDQNDIRVRIQYQHFF